ncbi:DUF6777 domain-containing protein [Thermomonospora cellulosilytica]|uniref:DUF6777 domain-containing protein n=1 Tax=Thermomonospora cellulosilytica TaxID=1411118 RepID=A0A7W3MZG2_9ACTN|nr:DUF6777 domain-containing protein [Thermomonospora cellulosilytica]MBA9004731.1 hypothetical protein [Thermomonospora cellulosilytica]
MSKINSGPSGSGRNNFRDPSPGRRAAVVWTALAMAAGGLAGCTADPGQVITRLAVGSPGEGAYTLVAGTDRRDTVPRPQAGGQTEGDTPGLYGGTRRRASCDPAALLRFLQRDPARGKAWAAVHRLDFSRLAEYFQKLTPVILRVDTLVTNHGYKSGKPIAFTAVLQAGVGVLVDEYGRPVVKCNCGNPLTAPPAGLDPRDARYEGTSWKRFDERTVTVIRPRDRDEGPMKTITLVTPGATMSFNRPAGTTGEKDGPPVPLPPGESAGPTDGPSGEPSPTRSPTEPAPTAPPGPGTPPGAPPPPAPSEPGGGPDDGPGDAPGGPDEPGPGDAPPQPPVDPTPNGSTFEPAPADPGGAGGATP